MATSFIKFKKEGVWLNDYFTEISINYLLQQIEQEPSPIPEWLSSLSEWWEVIRTGCISTSMTLKFDEYLICPDRIELMNGFIEKAIAMLAGKGEFISKEELNSFVFDTTIQTYWEQPLETSRIVKTLEYFQRILKGESMEGYRQP